MSTENRKTNEPHRFRLTADTLSLKGLNKNVALANLSIYYTWKNLKFLLQLGMMNLICLMNHILFQTFNNILNILLNNMKL